MGTEWQGVQPNRHEEYFNDFQISDRYRGHDLHCPCCGCLKVDSRLIDALELLSEDFGYVRIVHPPMCYDLAKRDYKRMNPLQKYAIGMNHPLYGGMSAIVDLDPFDPLVVEQAAKYGCSIREYGQHAILQLCLDN